MNKVITQFETEKKLWWRSYGWLVPVGNPVYKL